MISIEEALGNLKKNELKEAWIDNKMSGHCGYCGGVVTAGICETRVSMFKKLKKHYEDKHSNVKDKFYPKEKKTKRESVTGKFKQKRPVGICDKLIDWDNGLYEIQYDTPKGYETIEVDKQQNKEEWYKVTDNVGLLAKCNKCRQRTDGGIGSTLQKLQDKYGKEVLENVRIVDGKRGNKALYVRRLF